MHANLFLRYYSMIGPGSGVYTVSIDGSEPVPLSAYNGGVLTQQMLWSKTDLTPGRHTFTLRHDDPDGGEVGLDFFRSVTSEVME